MKMIWKKQPCKVFSHYAIEYTWAYCISRHKKPMESTDLARAVGHELRKPLVQAIEAIDISESLDKILNTQLLSKMLDMTDYVLEFIEIVTEPFLFNLEDLSKAMNSGIRQSRAAYPSVVFNEKLPSAHVPIDGHRITRLAELLLEQAAQTRPTVFISLSTNDGFAVVTIGDEISIDNDTHVETSTMDGKLSAMLLVCDQIVKIHGGKLWFSSSNHRTNFNFSLPLERHY